MNLLVIAVLFLLFWVGLVHFRRKRINFPSGPYGVPLLGYLPFVRKNAHKVIADLAKKHGSVFSLSYGTTPVVFANDYESINEVLVKKGDVFSGRTVTFVFETISAGKEVSFSEGAKWKDMRRFLLRHLRDFGAGKTSLESVIVGEADKLVEIFDKNGNNPICFDGVFVIPVMNVVWSITAGTTFAIDDKRAIQFKDDFQALVESLESNSPLNYFPSLRYIAPKLSGYEILYKSEQNIRAFLYSVIRTHAKEAVNGQRKDMIEAYMEEIERRRGHDGKEVEPFTNENMMFNMKTLFMGGTETTVTSLKWGFLMMAMKQDIQEKVHKELVSKIGVYAIPSWNHKNQLPYTDATLMEIQRYFTLAPLSVPHTAMADTTLLGYDIPKGTVVFTNLWAMHFDPKYWNEPEEFRPERFLDADGNVKKGIESYMPFSAGPRFCLGEPIARMELFIFFTYLLQKFRFELDPNSPTPSLDPVEGIVLSPKPYSLKVTRRNV